MGRNEQWTKERIIEKNFFDSANDNVGAGMVVFAKNGKRLVDDSETHGVVIGSTGTGKSQCGSLPYATECIKKHESLIVLDPKKEVFNKTIGYVSEDYQTFCIDFRDPYGSPTKWSPIKMPYDLFKSENVKLKDVASSFISEIASSVCPWDGHSDRFWTDASANLLKGLIYALFECAEPEYVNMDSVAVMLEQAEIKNGANTVLRTFYDSLPNDSLAKRCLATYANAPNETRASIHSVASSCIEVFSRSRGLMRMLCEDTLDILNIDMERPYVLYIILPDETNVYSSLAGLLVSQMSQHLIRIAQERGGKLPIRTNIILEELGSVGKSIPALPNLMVAGRSRNIRLMLVLQSNSQLVDVYGKSNAETINSCIGITIGFSTNNWETLNEWSQRCGERQVSVNGHIVKEPLITASQLAAMPTATALVMVNNRYKFISSFPFYDELYEPVEMKCVEFNQLPSKLESKTLDFEKFVEDIRRKKIDDLFSGNRRERKESSRAIFEPDSSDNKFDIRGLITRLDAKIAQLEQEEQTEKNKKQKDQTYTVVIMEKPSEKNNIAKIVAHCKKISIKNAEALLTENPMEVECGNESEARKITRELSEKGYLAIIRKNNE